MDHHLVRVLGNAALSWNSTFRIRECVRVHSCLHDVHFVIRVCARRLWADVRIPPIFCVHYATTSHWIGLCMCEKSPQSWLQNKTAKVCGVHNRPRMHVSECIWALSLHFLALNHVWNHRVHIGGFIYSNIIPFSGFLFHQVVELALA